MLNDQGYVKVKPTLELPDHPGVFAAGDIIAWTEQKQAGKAPNHAAVVAPNIISFLAGQPLKKVYKGSTEMILIPIGKVSSISRKHAANEAQSLVSAIWRWILRLPLGYNYRQLALQRP